MLQVGNKEPSAEVEFTDSKLERAAIIRLLLDFICKPFDGFDQSDYDDLLDLIRLVEKFDCGNLLRTIARQIEHPSCAGFVCRYARFLYACALDDVEAAHRLFLEVNKYTWTTGKEAGEATVNEAIKGARVLDLTTMSSVWVDRLPRKYFLALLRATRLHPDSQAGWIAVADEFEKQVKLQGEHL
jgi:hypothetical protein